MSPKAYGFKNLDTYLDKIKVKFSVAPNLSEHEVGRYKIGSTGETRQDYYHFSIHNMFKLSLIKAATDICTFVFMFFHSFVLRFERTKCELCFKMSVLWCFLTHSMISVAKGAPSSPEALLQNYLSVRKEISIKEQTRYEIAITFRA